MRMLSSTVMAASLVCLSPLAGALTPAPSPPLPSTLPLPAERPLPTALARIAHPLGPAAPTRPLSVRLWLRSRDPAGLAAYARAVATPGSPRYRRFLTPVELLKRFGPASASLVRVRQALRQAGFRGIRAQGFVLTASAPAAVVDRVFHTQVRRYRLHGQEFLAAAGTVTIPDALRPAVMWVGGLNTYRPPIHPLAMRRVPMAIQPQPQVTILQGHSTAPVSASSQGLTVTARLLSAGPRPTGLPASWLLTATFNGSPDANAVVVGGQASAAVGAAEALPATADGSILFRTTADEAGTPTIRLDVAAAALGGLAEGPAVEVTLPAMRWNGPAALPGPLSPSQVNQAYDAAGVATTANGQRATIALFAASAPIPGDLSLFCSANGLPHPTVHIVPVNGGESQVVSGNATELMLDLEALAAAAPGATIDVYTVPAAAPSFSLALNAALSTAPASVFSVSYGATSVSPALAANLLPAAAAEGMTVVNSSGDTMAYAGLSASDGAAVPLATVSYPAGLPQVTAVGGMEISLNAATGTLSAQAAWGGAWPPLVPLADLAAWLSQAAAGGSGGGFSGDQGKPTWQDGLVPGNQRGVPDLAFVASPNFPGFSAWIQGQNVAVGGTSLAAPLFAGWLADLAAAGGGAFGNINPFLYQLARHDPWLFRQAAYGSNGPYAVGSDQPGSWNPVTGLGSIDIGGFAAALADRVTVPAGGPYVLPPAANRSASSVALAESTYPLGPPGRTVVVASGADSNLIDALTSGPLAAKLKAPILLTEDNRTVGSAILGYVSRFHITRVYLMGIVGAKYRATVEQQLAQAAPGLTFVPVAGLDRYRTALAIARLLGQSATVFVASGNSAHIVDALAGSAAAAAMDAPILLVGAHRGVPAAALAGVAHSVVLGYAATYADTDGLPGRVVLQGIDRNATAVAVAHAYFPHAAAVVVASGQQRHLGITLAAGPFAAALKAPILLAEPGAEATTVRYLQGHAPRATVVVGQAAVDGSLLNALAGS